MRFDPWQRAVGTEGTTLLVQTAHTQTHTQRNEPSGNVQKSHKAAARKRHSTDNKKKKDKKS
jgi:hypothetical protein